VPASWLAACVNRAPEQIEERALQRWRRFLSQEEQSRPPRWRVVHQSFVDFLAEEGKVDLRAAHDRVASFYLAAWGGLDAGLPALFDPARRAELDAYGLQHLAEHLEQSGHSEDLHRLLRLERRAGEAGTALARVENIWFATRERVGQIEEYLNDLARAARLVQRADRADVESSLSRTSVGLEIRYALMATSLNSLASNVWPFLLAALVEKGVWLPAQRLAYARRVPSAWQRAFALAVASKHLEGPDKETAVNESLAAARALEDEDKRAMVLAAIGPAKKALDSLRTIKDEQIRASALLQMAPQLDPTLLRGALTMTRAIADEANRSRVLAALAPRLDQDLIPRALAMAQAIRDEEPRARALAALAPHLDETRRRAAREAARMIAHPGSRATVLTALGQVDKALALVRTLPDELSYAQVLHESAPHLSAAAVPRVLALANAMEDKENRNTVLSAVLPRLAELGRADEALESAQTIDDAPLRARAFEAMAPYLGQPLLSRALEAIQALRDLDRHRRARVLAALAPHLDQHLLRSALNIARAIEDGEYRSVGLATFGQVDIALEQARAIRNDKDRAAALRALAPHLSATLLAKVLDLAGEIRNGEDRAHVLTALGPYLRDTLIKKAVKCAQVIEEEEYRGQALLALTIQSATSGKAEAALALTATIGSEEHRARALVALGPRLNRKLHPRALQAARSITAEPDRAQALAALGWVGEALDTIDAVADDYSRYWALVHLAPHLNESLVPRALAMARALKDPWNQSVTLASIALALGSSGHPKPALVLGRQIKDPYPRAQVLAQLGPGKEALATVRAIEYEEHRAEALEGLAPRLSKSLLSEALEVARGIEDQFSQARALAALASRLAVLGSATQAFEMAGTITDEESRAKALAAMVPYLDKDLLPSALGLAQTIADGEHRAAVLKTLATRLAALDRAWVLPIWEQTLLRSARRSRIGLLLDLAALAPLIAKLGRSEASAETCRAIEDVGRWWP
jgi:hypothetical protein